MSLKTNNDEKCANALVGLYEVLDPEIGLNIVDLGLVYQIDFNEDNKNITVTMTLTTRFCPMGETIVDSTTQALQQSFPESKIHVNLCFDPPWEVSMVSEEGKKFLNF